MLSYKLTICYGLMEDSKTYSVKGTDPHDQTFGIIELPMICSKPLPSMASKPFYDPLLLSLH